MFPADDGRVGRIALIEENATRKIRMANLAIVGSHSTNGVAAIHSDLLRRNTVRDWPRFPERFNNKTTESLRGAGFCSLTQQLCRR